ncbi:hypothetical protein [Methylobacter sp.]|uniref:hypothetical protein n=1 Tax=Methylobacter sp. TaxID=2051955 RepID=UPI003DA62C37
MPYQQNIPQPTDQLDDSQGDILGNFQEIYNWVAVNHVQFGGAAGQGKHTQVTLPINAAPTPTAINEVNIYADNNVLTGLTELWWQRENNGERICFTALEALANGWTYLPSGVLLQWGTDTKTGSNQLVTLPAGNPPLILNAFYVGLTATGIGVTGTNMATYVAGSYDTLAGPPQTFRVNCFNDNVPAAVTFQYFIVGI